MVLDTNALMMPVELGVRTFDELDRLLGRGEYEVLVPEAVLAELDSLATGAGEESVAASVGADLARRHEVVGHDADYADDAVLEVATTRDCDYAVTNDAPLRNRLLSRAVPVIGLRGRNKLDTTRP
ncbi:MAG: PIN domain-containing protein [Haloarculaceae archaeon]